jgi:hypothetical protein
VVIGGDLLRQDVRALIGGHLMGQVVPLILSKSKEAMVPYLLTQVPPALNIVYSDVVRFRTHTDTHIALR